MLHRSKLDLSSLRHNKRLATVCRTLEKDFGQPLNCEAKDNLTKLIVKSYERINQRPYVLLLMRKLYRSYV